MLTRERITSIGLIRVMRRDGKGEGKRRNGWAHIEMEHIQLHSYRIRLTARDTVCDACRSNEHKVLWPYVYKCLLPQVPESESQT